MTVSVRPPGGSRSWLSLLPAPFCDNPKVVCYMVPRESKFMTREAQAEGFKGLRCTFAEFERDGEKFHIPLQFVGKDYGTFVQHKRMVAEYGGMIHPQKYVGPLQNLPAVCTMSTDFVPIIGLFNELHKPLLHLSEVASSFTKEAEING